MADIERFTARAPRKGNLDVPTDTGAADALMAVAQASRQIAGRLGQWADKARQREAIADATALTGQVSMPGVDFAFDATSPATTPVRASGAKAFKTSDPAATELPAHARAFLNAVSGGESGGSYNVRYTPQGAAFFSDLTRHPRIFVPGPHGKTSAAGRYQFTATTWDSVGGGDFSPSNQDRQAWKLAQRDYGRATGRNLDADLQAGGLTPTILSALTPTWQAFKGNGGRHIATYNDSLARLGAGPGTPAAPAAPAGVDPQETGSTAGPAGSVKVTLTGTLGDMPQAAPGTIYGDAFNEAAGRMYVDRLDTALRAQMDAVALQHQADPAGLAQALDAVRGGMTADMPPAARALIDQTFQREKLSLVRQATTAWQSEIESASVAALEENIAARTASAYRLAAKAGLDAAADAALGAELGEIAASIDASRMTPLQKSRLKADAASGVLSARVLGGLDAQKDAAGRAAYVEKFQQDWQAGEGLTGQIDLKTYDQINGELVRRVQADQVEAAKRTAAIDKSIDGQVGFLKKGWPVPEAQRAFLKSEVAKTGDATLAANLDFLDGLANWQKAHVAARPEVVDAQIAALEAKIQKEGVTEAAATTLDVMEGLRQQMAKGLADDPLTWANRAGVAAVEPLDFSDGARLAATLTERTNDAAAIAAHYGIEPKFFTAGEADGLKKMLKATPLALPSIVSSLSAGLGAATPKALGEISKDAPLLAHVGGLVHATGSQRAAVEIAEALELRQQPGYKSALPPAGKQQSAFSEHAGAAMLALPGAAAGAAEAAAALFEARATNRGVDMEQFDVAGSPARQLYFEALDEVLGATWRDGVKFGGITEVNGLETVAPPDIEADALEDMLADLSADDLLFQGAIGSANGVPIRLDQIRTGQLVMVAQGRYRVATGDVFGGDPLYLPNAEGGYFELDVGMLKRSQIRRAAPAVGGGWMGRRIR